MNARLSRFVASLALLLGLGLPASQVRAAAVTVDLTRLMAIQTYAIEDKADDEAFAILTGVAAGKELDMQKLPINGSWKIGPRTPAVEPAKPLGVWKGELADGQFALLTVTLFQGKGDDATVKAFVAKKAEAEKAVAGRSAAKATADEAKKIAADTLKAHKALVKDVKKIVGGSEKKTDHYGGQFTLMLWNNGGKIVKRLDPVGLTFGEHAGIDVKTYTKIKRTRRNVMMKDDAGEWYEEEMLMLNDDENAIRVKMLDTEMIKKDGKDFKNVTDYLAEIQVKADGKALKWKLGGENLGVSDVHAWWDWAD
ncbi:hypothetical protein [Humisphaera borealis]|uniref:Uncharacterized protein n=1 Tax=Humisphaera borealis TaxID=2807512 RepID=A0A7M2X2R1_9BACT|nr:hypothetical protein [Humisphaera borealis]QOV92038.1 hypothetical protein IPV69_12065 [Humisphaera borealis]